MSDSDDVDAEAEEVYNELNLLTASEEAGPVPDWGTPGAKKPLGGEDEPLDSSLGLGELAQLTVNNEAEPGYDQVSGWFYTDKTQTSW